MLQGSVYQIIHGVFSDLAIRCTDAITMARDKQDQTEADCEFRLSMMAQTNQALSTEVESLQDQLKDRHRVIGDMDQQLSIKQGEIDEKNLALQRKSELVDSLVSQVPALVPKTITTRSPCLLSEQKCRRCV